MIKKVLCMFVFFAGIAAAGFAADATSRDSIVCVVNGEVITVRELDEFINVMRFKITMDLGETAQADKVFEEEKKTALDKMIEDRLVAAEAKKRNYEVKPDQLEKRLDAFRKQFKDEVEFETELVRRGINLVLLKQKLTSQILMQQLVRDEVRDKVIIAPNEVSDYYQANMKEFSLPVSIDYRAVVFPDAVSAQAAYSILLQAINLESALSSYAKNIRSGKAEQTNALPEIASLFLAGAPKVNTPVAIGGEWYVFIIDARHDARMQPLAEITDKVRDRLYEKKFEERFAVFVEKLKKDAVILKKAAAVNF